MQWKIVLVTSLKSTKLPGLGTLLVDLHVPVAGPTATEGYGRAIVFWLTVSSYRSILPPLSPLALPTCTGEAARVHAAGLSGLLPGRRSPPPCTPCVSSSENSRPQLPIVLSISTIGPLLLAHSDLGPSGFSSDPGAPLRHGLVARGCAAVALPAHDRASGPRYNRKLSAAKLLIGSVAAIMGRSTGRRLRHRHRREGDRRSRLRYVFPSCAPVTPPRCHTPQPSCTGGRHLGESLSISSLPPPALLPQ